MGAFRSMGVGSIVVAAAVISGCGPATPDARAVIRKFNDDNGKRLVNLYAQYQAEYGVGPANEQELRRFIKNKSPAALEEMGVQADALDALFVSERDKQPFFIRYRLPIARGTQALVFESQGVGGSVSVYFKGPRVVSVPSAEVADYREGAKDDAPEADEPRPRR